jgi:hypothetical protein
MQIMSDTNIENDKYVIIKNAISKDACKILAREFRMCRDLASNIKYEEAFPYRDSLVHNSFSWYSPLCFEALSDSVMKEIIECIIKEPVYPTYSYARVYYNGAEMVRHVDRVASELAVSICIDVEENNPWHLGVQTIDGKDIYVEQEPGDAILYKGNELYHWRNKYRGNEQINAFMFYVRQNGSQAELKYDTRPMLGLGGNFKQLSVEEQLEKYSYIYDKK